MANGVKDLKVWQEAVQLAGDVLRVTQQCNRREVKVFVEHIQLTSAALASCVAEAHARYSASEQRECYQRAKRLLVQLETHLAIARRADLIQATALSDLTSRAGTVGRLLAGYLAFVERQVAAEPSVDAASRAAAANRETASASERSAVLSGIEGTFGSHHHGLP